MTVSCKWEVETLERETATGKVLVVHYVVKATDGTYSSAARGQAGLEGEISIPYSELDEETVIGWAQNVLAAQLPAEEEGEPVTMEERKTRAVTSVEAFLNKQISEQKAPTVDTGVPW